MKEPMERENRLASYISYKVLISKIYEELIQSLAITNNPKMDKRCE